MNIILEGSSYLRRLSKAYFISRYHFVGDTDKQIIKENIIKNLPSIINNDLSSIDKKLIKVIERSNQSIDSSYFLSLLDTIKDQPKENEFLFDKFAFSVFTDEILNNYKHNMKTNDLKGISKKIIENELPIIVFTDIPECRNQIDVKIGNKNMQYGMRNEYSNGYRPNYVVKGDIPFSNNEDLSDALLNLYMENDLYNALGGTIESYFKVEKENNNDNDNENNSKKKKEKERYKNLFIININSNKKKPIRDTDYKYSESNEIDHISILEDLFQQLDLITEKLTKL